MVAQRLQATAAKGSSIMEMGTESTDHKDDTCENRKKTSKL